MLLEWTRVGCKEASEVEGKREEYCTGGGGWRRQASQPGAIKATGWTVCLSTGGTVTPAYGGKN